MVSRTSMVSRKNATVINLSRSRAQKSSFDRFSCTISEIQNTSHSRLLADGKSYEHSFAKKLDGHKLYAKLRAESSFD
ncbi:hypothetical protein BHM03_00036800 [Ensete ventricosum]|nr:hypothetical protein BHM03_00036800 [Ensete ventricosum]